MRAVARQLHGDVSVRWIDDALPGLRKLSGEFGLAPRAAACSR
jgi:hypothetical protein